MSIELKRKNIEDDDLSGKKMKTTLMHNFVNSNSSSNQRHISQGEYNINF